MKLNLTQTDEWFFFEAMVNNKDENRTDECAALEKDGYEMFNNDCQEDGETWTLYYKKVRK